MSEPNRRNDARLKQLHDFYELLVLLHIVGPFVGPRTQGSSLNVAVDEESYTPLRRFLDRLSWMCDYDCGGETVSAIAIESPVSRTTVIWLATSHKAAQPTLKHLQDVLNLLRNADGLSARETHRLEKTISNMCIAFAGRKVKNYSKTLKTLFEKCQPILETSDTALARNVSHLIGLGNMPDELCTAADHFRDSESLRSLSRRVATAHSPSVWSLLRHYIGRLGSWHRAARDVVEYASTRPRIFERFEVRVTTTLKAIRLPRADESTSLRAVLLRNFALEEQAELSHGIQTLQRLYSIGPPGGKSNSFDLDSTFQEQYDDKNFKPRVHAEVWLLEHFYSKRLQFLDDDKYIGCSKPSCYCCDLYFVRHPGGFARRPSHGNVWTNWQSPLHQDQDSTKQALDNALKSSLILKFREDFKNRVNRPSAKLLRPPDTTTGFTLSDQ